jgi:hypothetical protein
MNALSITSMVMEVNLNLDVTAFPHILEKILQLQIAYHV